MTSLPCCSLIVGSVPDDADGSADHMDQDVMENSDNEPDDAQADFAEDATLDDYWVPDADVEALDAYGDLDVDVDPADWISDPDGHDPDSVDTETISDIVENIEDVLCGDVYCEPGYSCCNMEFVDSDQDTENCGSCNHACNANEACISGSCFCGSDPGCGPGGECCPSGGGLIPAGCVVNSCMAMCWCGGCDPDTSWCVMMCVMGTCADG